jgi:hypothetical protein
MRTARDAPTSVVQEQHDLADDLTFCTAKKRAFMDGQ